MKDTVILFSAILFFFVTGCKSGGNRPQVSGDPGLNVVSLVVRNRPLLNGKAVNIISEIIVNCSDSVTKRSLKKVILSFTKGSDLTDLEGVSILCGSSGSSSEFTLSPAGFRIHSNKVTVTGHYDFIRGTNHLRVSLAVRSDANLMNTLTPIDIKIIIDDGSALPVPAVTFPVYRYARIVRAAGQDNCDTYRIPGLITTNQGTLIAVYDNRYNSSKDLQENIDIGMSRSIDGGQSWEPMKVIMDMDEYGGRPQNQNGTGDPCILYDHHTGTILVAALWMCGSAPDKMLWNASQPGMDPEVTGQLIIVKSIDDGLSWSQPENITNQIKDPSWQLLLQGPGRGITMKDGTLVFPAQFKADIGEKALDGGQFVCHSTIVYSRDGGTTWHIGTGAKTNTTESQVVELSDGSLMLNMRDDRNRKDKGETNGRAVAITKDLGKTWITHPSSNSALPEPNCMASLISAEISVTGVKKNVLFFSNPANRNRRSNMTIKASLDEGMTWPEEYQIEINGDEGFGYSCLSIVDENTIGILYEGVRELYFQKIPVRDIIKEAR